MKVPFADFNFDLKGNEEEYSKLLLNHISKGEFIGGNSVSKFEELLSEYLDINNVITVGNGTDALIIALESLNLTKKEVLVPAFSLLLQKLLSKLALSLNLLMYQLKIVI